MPKKADLQRRAIEAEQEVSNRRYEADRQKRQIDDLSRRLDAAKARELRNDISMMEAGYLPMHWLSVQSSIRVSTSRQGDFTRSTLEFELLDFSADNARVAALAKYMSEKSYGRAKVASA